MMQRTLKPDFLASSIFEINYVALMEMGVRVLAFDIENTLVLPGRTRLDPKTEAYLKSLRTEGFRICLATHRRTDYREMVRPFDGRVIQPMGFGQNPDLGFFLSILGINGVKPDVVAMIGDNLLRDTTPASRLGMITVLVNPLGPDRFLQRVAGMRWQERRQMRILGINRPTLSS